MGPSDSEPRWLAITGFSGDRARVVGLISGRVVTVPTAELTEHWLETGIIVWERFDRVPQLLKMGEEGRGVLWLQRALAELHFFDGRPNGIFDGNTLAAVTRFQRERGLVSDGIAGPLTQIALYGQLDRYPIPRLSSNGSFRARPTSFPTPTDSERGAASRSGGRG
ncbi:MAG TPA: peptidoglycan-binding protein [Acidobacteria bacterium]|nr:peptidoglycan-binding protein [Acidobacteriota bacterium]